MDLLSSELMLLAGAAGHGLNLYCDRILSVFPNGKITLATIREIEQDGKLAYLLDGVPAELPMRSAILGTFSLMLEFMGYYAIADYVSRYSAVMGALLLAGLVLFSVLGTAHHLKYAFSEWLFIKAGRDAAAKALMLELFSSMPATRLCYAGYLMFVLILIAAFCTGVLPLPLWGCLFTVLPIFVLLVPFRIIGTMHLSAAASMLGWMLLFFLA